MDNEKRDSIYDSINLGCSPEKKRNVDINAVTMDKVP